MLLLLTSVAKVVSLRGERLQVGMCQWIRELDPTDGYFSYSDAVEQVGIAYLLLLGIAIEFPEAVRPLLYLSSPSTFEGWPRCSPGMFEARIS